jgi:hypothetical protein
MKDANEFIVFDGDIRLVSCEASALFLVEKTEFLMAFELVYGWSFSGMQSRLSLHKLLSKDL